jgi:predicted transcriptional regulator with HTH domain
VQSVLISLSTLGTLNFSHFFQLSIVRLFGHGNVKKVKEWFFVFIDVYIARLFLHTIKVFVGNVKSVFYKFYNSLGRRYAAFCSLIDMGAFCCQYF